MAGITSLGFLAYIQTFLCPSTTGGAGDPLYAAVEASSSFGSLAIVRTYARAQDAIPMILASVGIASTLLIFLKNTREARYFLVIAVLSASVYLWSNEPSWVTYLAFSSAFVALLVGLAAAEAHRYAKTIPLILTSALVILNLGLYNIGDTVDPSPTQARTVYNIINTASSYSNVLVISAGSEAEVVATYWEWEHSSNPLTVIKEHSVFLTPDTIADSSITFPPLEDVSTYDDGLYVNWDSTLFAQALASLNPDLDVYQLYAKEGDNYANKDYALRYVPNWPPSP